MKNVTISLNDDLAQEVRVEAAKAGKSLSRYISDLLTADLRRSRVPRGSQREALERILSGPKWSIMREGRMPTADERNER